MSRLADYPDIATLGDLYASFPEPFLKVSPLGHEVMRGDAPLTPAERELVAAHVSALNGCRYCHGIHAEVARVFGVDPELLAALAEDPDTAPVEPRMRPILALARQLTEAPARMTDAHAQAVRDAGWDDRAVVFTVAVTAYFNMMNRLVEGFGLVHSDANAARAGAFLAGAGYLGMRDTAAARAGRED